MTDTITLKEIEEIAQLESARMHHFYIGVEHLFIALTRLTNGVTQDVFDQTDHSARYLRYATRQQTGNGDDRRYWPGYRITPRAVAVLEYTRRLIEHGVQPDERALLMAILEEGDSIVIRAMQEASVNIDALLETVQQWSGIAHAQAPDATIEQGEQLTEAQLIVLQQMFRRKYWKARVEHIFSEGYSGSQVLLVRPVHGDNRADAPVVVKLDERQIIQYEKKRYDSFVKDTLPPRTARIEGEPILPDDSPLGGIKYTFLHNNNDEAPINLKDYAQQHTPHQIAYFLRNGLYEGFRRTWWGQAQPYTFEVWREYELTLPPALVIEATNADKLPTTGYVLNPLGPWSHSSMLRYGDDVELDGFTVLKVKRDKGLMQVTAGSEAAAINFTGRIDIHGLDLAEKPYFRGELIRRVIGKVKNTRHDLLFGQVMNLGPDFAPSDDYLPFKTLTGGGLPNPIQHYLLLLERRVAGTLSTIHGDLHTGNILISSSNDPWLIDFEWTRDGHTLFDWAVLEVSLLIDYITTFIGHSWSEAYQAIRILDQLSREGNLPVTDDQLVQAFVPILELRRIVAELLYSDMRSWSEYFVPLALCALRVPSWGNRSLGARRLAYLTSALAMALLQDTDSNRSAHPTSADLTSDQGPLPSMS